ncbi:hypothetical protein TH61_11430 [Rufibacter sp. DG15C]|uniref:glycosyltransferase family 2 protein n=1 Tax=Rufibacter sp. DG15C TaxID=1379909 RepID=UPI00078C68AC|nr:glycosyltransferase [Rufibacter sp. DG15C]AMM51666.1 hypothetical protein TH61_11430 [Rufibacter sp. DG15C]
MNKLLLSVVIPTYNRGDKILNILHSLSKQTISCFEVIVVNDGSTDNTADILNSLIIQQFPYDLRIVHLNNCGRAGVRNEGFRLANAELIVSFDDDMRPESNCLEVHLNHHKKNSGSILVGAQMEDPSLAETDIQKYAVFARQEWQRNLEALHSPMFENEIYITAGNFSIAKQTFNLLNGFDPRLNAIIDYDLAMRATDLGIPIYYNKQAFAWHDDFITCRSYVLRRRQGTENVKKLIKLKYNLVKKYHRYKKLEINKGKKIIYSLFAFPFLVKFIDEFNFFKYLLPKRIRYKFYEAVITSLGKYYVDKPL